MRKFLIVCLAFVLCFGLAACDTKEEKTETTVTETTAVETTDADSLAGDYQDTVSQRATACVEKQGDTYNIYVNWPESDAELKSWTMMDAVEEDGKLTYRGEEIGRYTYDEKGNEISEDVTMANNIGYFEIKDGMLYWTGAAQEECRACVFEKIVSGE